MTQAVPWTTAGPPAPDAPSDPDADLLRGRYNGLIALGAAGSPRSTQVSIGSSEVGYPCDRRIAYRLAGTPAVNHRDPVRTLVGLGLHLVLRDLFGRLGGGVAGWFLTDAAVAHGTVPGTLDLYDRPMRTVVDWKSTTKAKLPQLRRDGPPMVSVVQLQLYARGLVALGEDPRFVALHYIPIDGELGDSWLWRGVVDLRVADEAVSRVETLRGRDPATVPCMPDRLCPWCHHYNPNSTDLSRSCPGNAKGGPR